jgi:hypothetical protein
MGNKLCFWVKVRFEMEIELKFQRLIYTLNNERIYFALELFDKIKQNSPIFLFCNLFKINFSFNTFPLEILELCFQILIFFLLIMIFFFRALNQGFNLIQKLAHFQLSTSHNEDLGLVQTG